jgi:hypothetical protein
LMRSTAAEMNTIAVITLRTLPSDRDCDLSTL